MLKPFKALFAHTKYQLRHQHSLKVPTTSVLTGQLALHSILIDACLMCELAQQCTVC